MIWLLNKRYEDTVLKVIEQVKDIERLRKKSILITGASGLIGSYIVDMLIELNKKYDMNIKVYAAGRDMDRLRSRFALVENLKFLIYDVNEKISFDYKFDYIIYAASNAYPAAFMDDPVGTIIGNINGTFNHLNYAKKCNCGKFIYISTGEVYGNFDNDILSFKEENSGYINPIKVRSCYPVSKRAAENLCVSYGEQYDINTVIVRPSHTYGPNVTKGDNRANVQFVNSAIKGSDIVMKSAGRQLRSYTYIPDCASAILTVLLCGKKGEVYNISNENSIVTIAEFAQKVANICGKKVTFEMADEKDKKEQSPIERQVLNNERLLELGWKGIFDIDCGIRNMITILKE